jgi:lysyl-tRNA synthetase class II
MGAFSHWLFLQALSQQNKREEQKKYKSDQGKLQNNGQWRIQGVAQGATATPFCKTTHINFVSTYSLRIQHEHVSINISF